MRKNEEAASGADKKSKGVHVNHEYNQFEKSTSSESTWKAACHDPKKSKLNPLKLNCQWLTMQRRVWDDGKTANYVQLQVENQRLLNEKTQVHEIQFSADDTSILLKNTVNIRKTARRTVKVGKKKHDIYICKKKYCLCPISDEELKTICDADFTNIRIICGDGGSVTEDRTHTDVSDKQAEGVVTFLKCYYRECIDSDAYPEVAGKKPPKKPIPKWMIIVGVILILGALGNLL